MQTGKLTNDQLKELIFNKLENTRKETVFGPNVGRDCAVLDMDGDFVVVSTDPITGTEQNIGKLCVNICVNDVAAAGAEPVAMLVTCLIPPDAQENSVKAVIDDVIQACKANNVDLAGGHTEVSTAVNRYVLSGVCIGRKAKKQERSVRAGDALVMSKSAGLEGTGILAAEHAEKVRKLLGKEGYRRALSYLNETSVLVEGKIGAQCAVPLMHDATEGGVLGAAWEMADSANIGVRIDADKIPLRDETKIICGAFDLDPLRLISSGVMLFAAQNADELIAALGAQGIAAAKIGEFTNGQKIIVRDGIKRPLCAPESDELYKAVKF